METYTVFYLFGGVENFVCKKIYNEKLSIDHADSEVRSLIKMGFPAMAIETYRASKLGGFCCHNEFDSIEKKSKYWAECHINYIERRR